MDRCDDGGEGHQLCRHGIQRTRLSRDHRIAVSRRACGGAANDAPRNLCCSGPPHSRRADPAAGGAVVMQTLHIILKDLNRLRWLLLLWVGILIVRVTFWSLDISVGDGLAYAFLVGQSIIV